MPEAKKEQKIITVYKIMPFDTFVKCLEQKGLKASLPYSSANPMENLPWCEDETDLARQIQKAKDHNCVLMSFTENVASPTLWGLYGDGGAGVCLEFCFPAVKDATPDEWCGQEVATFEDSGCSNHGIYTLNKMEYGKDFMRKKCDVIDESTRKSLMLYKSKEWKFEKEYRFVVPMSWASSCRDGVLYFAEPLRYLNSVYLGPLSPHSPSYLSSLIGLKLFNDDEKYSLVDGRTSVPVERAYFDETRFIIHLSKEHEDKICLPPEKDAGELNKNEGGVEQFTLLYMYASEKALKSILDTWSLKASLTHDVNDPMECMPQKYHVSEPVARSSHEGKAAYLCFSKTMSSPSMWGNYADEGKGACLAFLFPLVKAGKKGMGLNHRYCKNNAGVKRLYWRDVKYLNVRACKNKRHDITLRKSKDWSYEQEVRCFCEPMDADIADDGMLLYHLPMRFLAGVILGPRSQYATQYMQKKLAQGLEMHKQDIGNWPVENNIIPWLLCTNACYHHTKYAFYAHPWFDNSSADRFYIARKIAESLKLLKFPLQFPWHEKRECTMIKKQKKNWGVWADLLNELSDDEAKELASLSDETDFAERIVSRLDSRNACAVAESETTCADCVSE